MLWIFVLAIIMPIELGLCESANSATNLHTITWSHAVNSWHLLNESLANDVKMVEADILIGKHTKNPDKNAKVPIMAHPPQTSSDLSLEEFLQAFIDYNADKGADEVKGIKLDFKTIETFTESLNMLEQKAQTDKFPIWLNADIIKGPVDSKAKPVDANQFLQGAAKFPNHTLSLGWTTNWGKSSKSGKYVDDHIDHMLTALEQNKFNETKHPITFAVRAGIAASSLDTLQRLLKAIDRGTLTVWSSPNDAVNVDELKKVISAIGYDRVYVDVPKDLYDKLFGGDKPAEGSASTIAHFGLLNMVIVLLHKLF